MNAKVPILFDTQEFLAKDAPMPESGKIMYALNESTQMAIGRNTAGKPLVDSYNRWSPVKTDKGVIFNRSSSFLEHRGIRTDLNFKNDRTSLGKGVIKIVLTDCVSPEEKGITPNQCRLNGGDYVADLKCRFMFYPDKPGSSPIDILGNQVTLLTFPVMLGSELSHIKETSSLDEIIKLGECIEDPFGYFVVGGNEKVLVCHEKTRYNIVTVISKPIKVKKTNEVSSLMISRFFHITHLISVTFTPVEKDMKYVHYEALAKRDQKDPFYDKLLAAYPPPEKHKLLPNPCLQIKLNCFDKSGIMFFAFMIYYFRDILFTKEEQKAIAERPLSKMSETLKETNKRIFEKIKLFVDPMLHDMVYNLLYSDLYIVSHELNKPEYSKNITFFEIIEDYVYWNIRPQNIEIKFIIGGNLTKAKGKFKRFMSDGMVNKSMLDQIITENFIQRTQKEIANKTELFYLTLFIAARLLELMSGRGEVQDQNNLGVRRFETPGKAMEDYVGKMTESMMNGIEFDMRNAAGVSKEINISKVRSIINDIIKKENMSDGMRKRFAQSFQVNPRDTFVTELLSRENMIKVVSGITNNSIPISRETKGDRGFHVRLLSNSKLGYTDPSETPERSATGLVNHNSAQCFVSTDRDPEPIEEELIRYFDINKPKQYLSLDYAGICFLNGKFLGWGNAQEVYENLIVRRRKQYLPNSLPYDLGIHIDHNTKILYVVTDADRPLRPLLVTSSSGVDLVMDKIVGGKTVEDWDKYIKKNGVREGMKKLYMEGAIEFVDPIEQPNLYICQRIEDLRSKEKMMEILSKADVATAASADGMRKERFTHCEIDPVMLFGYVGTSIPRANCTMGPRNTLEDNMAKQALGTYHTNPRRMDNAMRNLAYPTRSLFEPETTKMIGMDVFPTGQMTSMAVCSLLGQTQEDSLICDQRSLDYGVFGVIVMRTKKKIVSDKIRDEFRFVNPYSGEYKNITRRLKDRYLYRYLDRYGIPRKGTYLHEGECIIGCIHKPSKGTEWEDDSVFLNPGEEGYVDNIFIGSTKSNPEDDGNVVVRIRLRILTTPQIGDKFALRYSQKATVGLILHPFDLPHNEYGIVPGFIVNPHAIPARMTVALTIEFLASRLGSLMGHRVDATTFQHYHHDEYEGNDLRFLLAEILGTIDKQKDIHDPAIYEIYMLEKDIESAELMLDGKRRSNLAKQVMYDGVTGEKYPDMITFGPVYTRSLKHLVADKFQVRGRGKRQDITFEANSGRGQGGATRLGEMENAAIMTQGGSEIIYDRFSYSSGEVTYMCCRRCGNPAGRRLDARAYYCTYCDKQNQDSIVTIDDLLHIAREQEAGKNVEEPDFVMIKTRRAFCALKAYLAGCGIGLLPKIEKAK